jgi:rhamnosyltransferase
MTRSVVAVVTAFNPGESLIATCAAADKQVEQVVVVDDGSPRDVSDMLGECRSRGWTVIESADNGGIARALNLGVTHALSRGADAVLTLDQDTIIDDDYVQRALAHLDLAESLDLPDVMLSTSTINDLVAPFWFAHKGLTLAFEPIQSGLLITRSLFEKVGLFEEDLFIDCVETEFYLRARAHGGHALVIPGAGIEHLMGQPRRWVAPRPLRWVLRGSLGSFEFREDAAFRHYYIMRNRWTVYRRYARSEPLWCAVSVFKDSLARAGVFMFGSRRLARMYLTASGFRASVRGETGKIPDRVMRRARLMR